MRLLPTLLTPALLLATACYNEARYDADYDVAFCDKVFECSDPMVVEFLPYQNVEDCLSYRARIHEEEREEAEASNEDPTCDFDPQSAQDCVDATANMGCEAYNAGSFPPVCDDVCGLAG